MIIKVHQALHGYSDGHRQLACSARLSPQDAKLVLVMSDVSGSGVASEGSSYLTGYPLSESGMYALARTWSAPEMPRPGCVWTHTLFIDFPDLAAIGAPSRLAKLFARPESPSWSSYGTPGTLDLLAGDGPEPRMTMPEEDWVAGVLSGLYESASSRVVAKRDPSVPVDALTLRIWDQQWPRLRRSFRFCTFTTKDRSTLAASFDLQILPGPDVSSRARLPNTREVSPMSFQSQPDWLMTLMDDVRQPNYGGLRDTLKRLGADILGGREAMPVFCTFHRLTSGPVSPNKLHEAIEMVDEPGPLSTSDLARAQVADYVLSNVEDADTRALDFLWDQWHYIEPSRLQQRLPDVAAPLWRASQRRLLAALRNPADDAAGWAAQMLKAVPTEDLLADWPERDVPLRELLRARPDLVEVPAFWAVVDVRSAHDLNGLPMTDTAAVALVHGMEREPGMRAAVQALGRVHVLKIVQLLSGLKDSDGRELRWVRYCVDDASAVAEFMSQVQAPAQALLMEFARTVSPDSVPNQYGDDPWYTALLELRNAKGSLPHRLAAYAFARALGRSSRNIGELLQMTFEQLHAAVSNSALADDDWRLIEPRLSWVSDDKRWNRAGRLRNAVASAYLDRHLWPRGFAWMASDNSVFVALMEETAERWGGKRFLKTVEESLEQETDALWRARRELIHWFLKRK
ncbi:MAG: hypothetical protein K9J82_06740 [Methylotenera sp.]|nr:hypothetical protein [Methylotenera sp.]